MKAFDFEDVGKVHFIECLQLSVCSKVTYQTTKPYQGLRDSIKGKVIIIEVTVEELQILQIVTKEKNRYQYVVASRYDLPSFGQACSNNVGLIHRSSPNHLSLSPIVHSLFACL